MLVPINDQAAERFLQVTGLLPRELPMEENLREVMLARFEALGYNEPLLVQFGIYLKNIFTNWDFGTSWYV